MFQGEPIKQEHIREAFEFSYSMAFVDGFHRNKRSGGIHNRSAYEVFVNTFRGKIAEFVVSDYFTGQGREVSQIDLSVMGVGDWDSADLLVDEISISIKATKHFGQLLLLETKDWNDDGQYIPNLSHEKQSHYDYFILVRTKVDIPDKNNSLFSKEKLKKIIFEKQISAEISGVLSNYDFVNQIIKYKYIIYQNDLLNGKISMDADNYYG
ncbi:hypothetical protein [Streptococcus orisratti]|uniref:hypothetical protein n=1 Tax=Streptococcus orisratti TaxID=114652 RepID=UPI0023F8919A|nr:hypothetical protein [Streptococcus orisratti]